jgi:hypothetical protein
MTIPLARREQARTLFAEGVGTHQIMNLTGLGHTSAKLIRDGDLTCKRCAEDLGEPIPDRLCGFCREEQKAA